MRRPIVIVPACSRDIGVHPYHAVQYKYVEAVVRAAHCTPLILPALGEGLDMETVLSACDGILFTGAASNLHPKHYAQEVHDPALPQDAARDATTLPLVRAALKRAIPVLAICRGFQEMNVALGGSLHQAVQEVPGMLDHRDKPDDPLEKQYGPAHAIRINRDGLIARILGSSNDIVVNSLHGQGVNNLAPGLVVEATAEDGLVEAFSAPAAPAFALGLQWHPEWMVEANPVSMKLFGAFGIACREHHARREKWVTLREP